MITEGLLTKEEAAARLRCSVKTIRKYVQQGKLRAVRRSKTASLLFRSVDVERCIENMLTPAVDVPDRVDLRTLGGQR